MDQFSKFFHWLIPKEILYVIMREISTSPELRCYTTMLNLKIQNNCLKNASVLRQFFLKY